jgi:hypothetical protein
MVHRLLDMQRRLHQEQTVSLRTTEGLRLFPTSVNITLHQRHEILLLTMLPLSVEPRANIRVTFRHIPLMRSFEVSLVWRSSSRIGEAVTAVIRVTMVIACSFMFAAESSADNWEIKLVRNGFLDCDCEI